MFGVIVSAFFMLIAYVIYKEYKNEKAYRESREEKNTQAPQKETVEHPKETPKSPSKLPKADFPVFSHNRLIEMGLSDEEAKEFVMELAKQIEDQIPLIEKALNVQDYAAMERLTHSLKGSATNIGTGGVSDLLVQYNTYLKTGEDHAIAQAYFKHLQHYTKALKQHYT